MQNKEGSIPASLLAEVSEFVSGRMGLYFPEGRRSDLERGLRSASIELGFDDPEACARWLISSSRTKRQIEVLASHLTVGETYFFRDRRYFDFLKEKVLPELIGQRTTAGRYLRVWSAGCCTGEEPYSIAILLNRIMGDRVDWNITILGTDINPLFLKKASAAIYGDWSFRDTPEWVRAGYFTKTKKNEFALLPEIRKRVFFTYHNLAENAYPSLLNGTNAMDLILCRNVLMYLTPDHQRHVARKLRQCLVEGGWLIVSPGEASHTLFSEFEAVTFQGVAFYRRSGKSPPEDRSFLLGTTSGLQQETAPLPWPPECPVGLNEQRAGGDPPALHEEGSRMQKMEDPYEEALVLYREGSYTEVKEKLGPLLSEETQGAKAAALLARAAANQGRLSEALSLCEKAIAADRCDPGHYYLRATILQEEGKLKDAAVELKKALYLDQDFVLAHFLLGNLALRRGSAKESARHFRNAVALLSHRHPEEGIPGAEGLTAGRLMEIIKSTGFEDVT